MKWLELKFFRLSITLEQLIEMKGCFRMAYILSGNGDEMFIMFIGKKIVQAKYFSWWSLWSFNWLSYLQDKISHEYFWLQWTWTIFFFEKKMINKIHWTNFKMEFYEKLKWNYITQFNEWINWNKSTIPFHIEIILYTYTCDVYIFLMHTSTQHTWHKSTIWDWIIKQVWNLCFVAWWNNFQMGIFCGCSIKIVDYINGK